MKEEELTQEIVRELIDYDPETGKCYWRERDKRWFRDDGEGIYSQENLCKGWNTRYSGKETGTINKRLGYITTRVFNIDYRLHRLIWFRYYGEWPNCVDHINGIRTDNRIVNLRNVTPKENNRNAKKRKDNTSGYVGIFWNKRDKKWRSDIRIDGKLKFIGQFENKEDAIAARKAAEIKYNFHKNHGREA